MIDTSSSSSTTATATEMEIEQVSTTHADNGQGTQGFAFCQPLGSGAPPPSLPPTLPLRKQPRRLRVRPRPLTLPPAAYAADEAEEEADVEVVADGEAGEFPNDNDNDATSTSPSLSSSSSPSPSSAPTGRPLNHGQRCLCGCVPNVPSLFEMAELRKQARLRNKT